MIVLVRESLLAPLVGADMMLDLSLLAQTTDKPVHFEPGGMIIMGLSVAMVLLLCAFCTWRLLRDGKQEQS